MTTTLITGATGFIAGHLARAVRRIVGGRIAGLGIRPSADSAFNEWYTVDLRDPAAARGAIGSVRPGTVYHLVGSLRGSDEEIAATNVVTSRNVLEALRHLAPDARVVLMGSAAEYGVVSLAHQPVSETFVGVPTGPYGRAKQQVTALALAAAREFDQHVTVARPFNVLGPGVPDTLVVGALISRLRAALAAPGPRSIRIGRTTGIRDFVAVEDVAEGLVRIAGSGLAGHCYNLCSGEGHTIAEVLERLLAEVGEPISVSEDETLLRAGDVDQMIGSWDKAQRELGWRPTIRFEDSLYAAWKASDPTVA
jgi:GDP-4-dehydro-6-deoxy-D-mannose reductase